METAEPLRRHSIRSFSGCASRSMLHAKGGIMKVLRTFAVWTVLVLFVFTAVPLYAADDPVYKLGRGMTNLLTGAGELVIQVIASQPGHDPLTGTFTGLFRGVFFTVARELTGVYEVLSFPIPVPKNYEPLWKPATIFEAWKEITASTGKT